MQIVALHRYPLKGFSPEPLDGIVLRTGEYVPGDRLFAVENGPSGFDPAAPRWLPKIAFLMLMRNEAIARIRTRYEDGTGLLHAEADGLTVAIDPMRPEGRLALEAFLRRVVPGELRGPPKLLAAPEGHRFTDSRKGYVSLINRASVLAVERMVGRPVDPLRFRGNLLVEGLEPWQEFDLVGRTLAGPGGLRLDVTSRIVRCAATNVDPDTGARDLAIPRALAGHLGHSDLGIYAAVSAGGALARGDRLDPVQGTLALEA